MFARARVCVCRCGLRVYVCLGGLVIRVLCQLMRGERGHLFRGAGLRAPGTEYVDGGLCVSVMKQLLGAQACVGGGGLGWRGVGVG